MNERLSSKMMGALPGTVSHSPGWRRGPRSLTFQEWPKADQDAWLEACRPGHRLRPGGAASHLNAISRGDLERRYGAYLAFLERASRLERYGQPAAHVTPVNVADYLTELKGRVRSVTVWNAIYKLRRLAELISPRRDFSWLTDIENDLALVMEPQSKIDRLVLSQVLVETGLTLIVEAETDAKPDFVRARAARNGLMIALLALCPIRIKNFASLELGRTIRKVDCGWWIVLPGNSTKTRTPDERPVPDYMGAFIDKYVNLHRPRLIRAGVSSSAFWISSSDGKAMTTKGMALTISKTTRRTLGVDVSPHLFRTAAASTAAVYGGSTPHLASAVLTHRDPRITEEHYTRASSMSAARAYAAITDSYRVR